jgi:hypothetical protein
MLNATRRHGLLLLLGAGAVAVAIAMAMTSLHESGWNLHGYGWALPGAIALTGLLELVSGVPFSEWSQRWDSLAGWQRGVLGVLIVAAALVGIFALMILAAYLLYGD